MCAQVHTTEPGSCAFANQDDRKFEMLFWQIVESIGGPEQGYRHCFADVTNQD